ncbi:MAG: metallopeptidase TldD-related protein [Candidatus Methanofastidiosia archaeon]|jgi:predicted Zn-dependent protease
MLQKLQGEYIEKRYSSVVYHDLNTQKGDKIQKSCKEGFSIRIIDKGRLKVAFSEKEKDLDGLIQSAKWTPITGYTPVNPVEYYEKQPEPVELPVDIVENILEKFKSLKSAEARLESLTTYEHICTNLGTNIYHGNSKVFVRIFLTPLKGFTIVYPFGYPGGDIIKELEQLEEIDLNLFSHPYSIDKKRHDVILSPFVTGMIFHEISHLFEGSIPKIHEFPTHISISDNPKAEGLGGYKFDSEGCEASQYTLTKNGIIHGCLASVLEPGNRNPTGNARASSFDVQPIPRQSNLEINIQTEQYKKVELLELVKDGIYIDQIGQASVFPGNIVYFTNTVSYRIKKGEISEPILNIHFGGNLFDIIKNIQYTAPAQRMIPAVCWKNYQRLFITTKAPFSLVRKMPLSCYSFNIPQKVQS